MVPLVSSCLPWLHKLRVPGVMLPLCEELELVVPTERVIECMPLKGISVILWAYEQLSDF